MKMGDLNVVKRLWSSYQFRLINAILENTGITFTNSVKDKIFKYADGHLFPIHALGSALYNNQKNGKVIDKEWKIGFEEAMVLKYSVGVKINH